MGQRLQQSVRTVRVSCRQLTFNLILWSILTALWTGTFSPRKSFRRPFRDFVFPIENREEVKGRSPRGKTGVGLLKRWMDSGGKEAFFASFHRLVRGCHDATNARLLADESSERQPAIIPAEECGIFEIKKPTGPLHLARYLHTKCIYVYGICTGRQMAFSTISQEFGVLRGNEGWTRVAER